MNKSINLILVLFVVLAFAQLTFSQNEMEKIEADSLDNSVKISLFKPDVNFDEETGEATVISNKTMLLREYALPIDSDSNFFVGSFTYNFRGREIFRFILENNSKLNWYFTVYGFHANGEAWEVLENNYEYTSNNLLVKPKTSVKSFLLASTPIGKEISVNEEFLIFASTEPISANFTDFRGSNELKIKYFTARLRVLGSNKVDNNPLDRFVKRGELGVEGQKILLMNNRGLTYYQMGDYLKAKSDYEEALKLVKESKDYSRTSYEALILNNLGQVYLALKEAEKALDIFKKGLTLFQTEENKQGESLALSNIALVYSGLSEFQKAIDFYQQALVKTKEIGDKKGEITILTNLGKTYSQMGDIQKFNEYLTQSLQLSKSLNDSRSEVMVLNNLASGYSKSGEKQKALNLLNQSLNITKKIEDRKNEAITLSNIAQIYDDLGNKKKAKDFIQQSLLIGTTVEKSLNNVLLETSGEQSKEKFATSEVKNLTPAEEEAQKTLQEYLFTVERSRKRGALSAEASALTDIMVILRALNSPYLAISYGKQAVNTYQKLRSEIKGGNLNIQTALLRSYDDAHRILAEILIEQGRISEAEKVQEMLKEQEFFAYVRRDDSVISYLVSNVNLSNEEKDSLKRYSEIADNLTKLADEFGELDIERKKHDEGKFPKQARYDELEAKLSDAKIAFRKFLDELKIKFGQEDKRIAQVESSLQNTLKRLKENHTAVVQTLVGENQLNIIVTTANAQKAHTINIPKAKLNELVADFRQTLNTDKYDPRPKGQELYNLLIRPIEADLAGIAAKTILWSLDGTLRYIPPAAVWDKKKGYLVERFENVVLTLASRDTLTLPVSDWQNWKALGVGVSEPAEGFNALLSVPDELDCIISDPQTKTISLNPICENGVLNGKKLLNEKFTLKAFKDALGHYEIVHIASHFKLTPGTYTDSFLLLGGTEKRFTVKDLQDVNLTDVELFVLSACNTATPGGEKTNGLEIEGFGSVAQIQGAKAVLATLWSVDDKSTQIWMTEFYRLRKENPNMNKAEAMQLAQQKLVKGEYKTLEESARNRSDEIFVEGISTNPKSDFKKDEKAPYSHPFYWSPFVLIGNWK